MLQGFDHIILLTHDLDETADRFASLGFSITNRLDVEVSATENRLVCFSDGSYIEIVRFRDPAMLATHRFAPVRAGGWAEYVARTDDLAATHAGLAQAGLPTSPIRKVRKSLADGQQWEVWLSHFGRGVGDPAMPMLAEDRTDHHLRVPMNNIGHANGARRVGGVSIAVTDLESSRASLSRLLASGPAADGKARFDLAGGRWVELVTPPDGSPEATRLAEIGNHILSITIGGASGPGAVLGGIP